MTDKSHKYLSKIIGKVDGRDAFKQLVETHWDDVINARKKRWTKFKRVEAGSDLQVVELNSSRADKCKMKLKRCWNKTVRVKEKHIFSYKNKLKERWDVFMIICAISNSFFIPLEYSFEFQALFTSVIYRLINNFIDFLFVVDIVVMFF
jgi:hypothetical protein